MLRAFDQADTSFASNGNIIIQPSKAYVHKEDNADYYLDLECSLDYLDFVVPQNIIVANTPQGDQPFRISDVKTTRTKIIAKCKHISYDSQNYLILDSYVVDKNCNDALDHLNNATDNTSPFTTISDITARNSFRCVRKSLWEAIGIVLERWGGHLVRDGWNIGIMNEIGADNGIVIQYKKNLKEIAVEYDWGEVVTKLLPVGRDGLLLDDLYVSSDVSYEIPFTKTVTFSQDIDQDEFPDEESYIQALKDDLRAQAQVYVNEHCIPKVNYTLKANLEKLTDIGDVVDVIDERLGLNLQTRVISFTYDCILNKYVEVEFGNSQAKLSDLLSNVQTSINTATAETAQVVTVTLEKELQEAQDAILGIMGNSYVIYNGDQILIVDSLPKETAHNVIRLNSQGIGFSQNGINGTFNSAWQINGTLDMQHINVINLVADMIKGGTLKLGSNLNSSGILEIYDAQNNLIGKWDNSGLRVMGADGSYILMNTDVGFAGYDRNDQKIYWVAEDEFHMKKSVVEEEITLCGKMRFIAVTTATNDGIGLVPVV